MNITPYQHHAMLHNLVTITIYYLIILVKGLQYEKWVQPKIQTIHGFTMLILTTYEASGVVGVWK